MNSVQHKWRFYRAGGLDQIMLRNGQDILNLSKLDQKLWTALSSPTKGIEYDATTLTFLDADNDGRIRSPEILANIEWLRARLVSLDSLFERSDTISLAAINPETPEGQALATNARRIMDNLGKSDAASISLADATDTAAIFANTNFNGDGVIPADAADTDDTKQLIGEIIDTQGEVIDRSGKPGVNQEKLDAFYAAINAYRDWAAKADESTHPLGDDTPKAYDAYLAVRSKISDYFTRCRLADFDARAAAQLNRAEGDFATIGEAQLSDGADSLDTFPLALVAANQDLPLTDGINPYWAAAMETFRSAVVAPLLDASTQKISDTQWQKINETFAPFEAWQAAKTGDSVAALGLERINDIAAGSGQKTVSDLIARDLALEPENDKISELERLLRLHAHFVELLDNYVNMSDLYDPGKTAIFQVGTLYMDARSASLCFHVDNIDAHAAQAEAGKCCIAYCQLTRAGTAQTRTVCAVFTAGFARSLWVGRNGIFYDRRGNDWDAVIVKILAHPISLKEAFWDPWRKIADMIGGQIRKMLESKNEAVLSSAAQGIESAATAAPAASAPPDAPKKMEGAALASSVAAIGIAVGLLGTAVGGLVSTISGLPPWKTLLGLVAVLLVVSGPSVVLTWFKLRARDLAPILNACGWAINRPLRMSLKLAQLFTAEAAIPRGSERQLTDPYADGKTARLRFLIFLLAVAAIVWLWVKGYIFAP